LIIDGIKSRTLQDLIKVLSGNVVARGLGFPTIVLISRDLGPSQCGIVSLFLAPLSIFIQMPNSRISTSKAVLANITERLIKAACKECRAEAEESP